MEKQDDVYCKKSAFQLPVRGNTLQSNQLVGPLAEFEAAMKDIIASEQPLADYLLRERELKQLIEAEARCLPKKMREIFYMSRELHLTHKEIAARLDLSPATVKKQVNNALKILRIKLEAFFAIIWFLNL